MAKKVVKKKVRKKVKKHSVSKADDERKIVENEERQLLWFFAIIVVVFLSFLIPYFYFQNLKTFNYAGIEWAKKDAGGFDVYHGVFPSMVNLNLEYNVYFRTDPRKNNVPVDGSFGDFKYGGYVSFDKEASFCTGEASRAVVDLVSFLNRALGIGDIKKGTIDEEFANETKGEYVTCSNNQNNTVVILQMGDEGSVIQNDDNPFCYTITLDSCDDSRPMEKFMTTIIANFYEDN